MLKFEIRDLQKFYQGRQVLNVENFAIESGEILALVGPNGAGKSTFLRLLHFLEPADKGEIYYKGQHVRYPADLNLRRGMSMVFQRPMLFNASVWDNVTYGLKIRGLQPDGRVQEVLEQLELLALKDEHARNLSGGEIQRVALAQSLVLDLEVLFLDEPIANLDPSNARLIGDIIRFVKKERGLTVLLVSHHIPLALRIADRIAALFAGEIVEILKAENFKEGPINRQAKAFFEMNMLPHFENGHA